MTLTLLSTAIAALLYDAFVVYALRKHIRRRQNPGHPSCPWLWLGFAFISLPVALAATFKVLELATFKGH
jgi:hypothetical protein